MRQKRVIANPAKRGMKQSPKIDRVVPLNAGLLAMTDELLEPALGFEPRTC
jgi:hypothetical protein